MNKTITRLAIVILFLGLHTFCKAQMKNPDVKINWPVKDFLPELEY